MDQASRSQPEPASSGPSSSYEAQSGESTPQANSTAHTPASSITALPVLTPTASSSGHLMSGPTATSASTSLPSPPGATPVPAAHSNPALSSFLPAPSTGSGISPNQAGSTGAGAGALHVSTSSSSTSVARPRTSRSNSLLMAERPAPPSPASSRAGSRPVSTFAPSLGAVPGSPSTSTAHHASAKDRTYSTSSSVRGRRVSGSSRASGSGSGSTAGTGSNTRPRSSLFNTTYPPTDGDPVPSPTGPRSQSLPDSSLASTPIPENAATGSPLSSPAPSPAPPALPVILIRDYAFPSSDDRHRGIAVISSASQSRRGSAKWWQPEGLDGSSPRDSGLGGNGKKGWTGFNLLGWRFGSRSRKSSADLSASGTSLSSTQEGDTDLGLGPDVASPLDLSPAARQIGGVGMGEDDFVFDSDSSTADPDADILADEEPCGLYRAAYRFEAVGEHEIGVEEGDLIDVQGRGGGDGWVIGVRKRVVSGKLVPIEGEDEDGVEGLVPESYLEKADDVLSI